MEEGTYYMNLTYGDVTYSGGFCQMRDEAGTEVMTFSAVGENKSIWGVKYQEYDRAKKEDLQTLSPQGDGGSRPGND